MRRLLAVVLAAAALPVALGWSGPRAQPRAAVTAASSVTAGKAWAARIRLSSATRARVVLVLSRTGARRTLVARRVGARTYAARTTFAAAGRWSYRVLVAGRPAATGAVSVMPGRVRLANPYGLDVDGAGNAYVADGESHRVLRWDSATRRLTLLAGTGAPGSSGDGGPATRARLGVPTGLAVDADGTVFVADFAGSRIRRIDPGGIISTVAGTGRPGRTGDGAAATAADLGLPADVALDRARRMLYVVTLENYVRAVDLRSGTITTVAGDGTAASTGDGGPAVRAQVNSPHGVEVDPAGNVLLGDVDRLRRIDIATGVITTVAPLETHKTDALADGTILYVRANPGGGSVHRIEPGGAVARVAGNDLLDAHRDGGPAIEAGILPSDLVVAPDGALLVTQTEPVPAIRRVDLATGVISTLVR